MTDKANQEIESTEQEQYTHKYLTPEIESLDHQILELKKQKEITLEVRIRANVAYDKVMGWCLRVIDKVDQHFGQNIGAFSRNKSLPFLFEKISEAICLQLNQMISEQDDELKGYITAKDFMNDFCTQDFLDRNIRIRPVTADGRTTDDNKTAYNDPTRMYLDTEGDLEKQNNIMLLEMEEQRNEIKQQFEIHQ